MKVSDSDNDVLDSQELDLDSVTVDALKLVKPSQKYNPKPRSWVYDHSEKIEATEGKTSHFRCKVLLKNGK